MMLCMVKRHKSESLILAPLIKKIAPSIGARVVLEPTWNIVGQITFKSGKRSYFRYNALDLNPVGASDVAKDKDYAVFFMKKMGYPVPVSRAFFSDEWAQTIDSDQDARAAVRYAKKIGFPLFVKPNSGSQGTHVSLVRNARELVQALKEVFKRDRIALLQKPVPGRDYRIVVLDGAVISAYERIPLHVIGDGRSTVLQLLKQKQKAFDATNRDTRIKFNDPRIVAKLRAQKLSLASIPAKDSKIYLLDNANLSSGGDAVDVTDSLHPSFKRIATRLTRDMGLRFAGVDILCADATKAAKKYCVLEINAAPGLDHYVKTGLRQRRLVEAMYRKVLKSLAK